MALWFGLALMSAAAVWAVLWPLAGRRGEFRSGSDLAVYRDQLAELERDREAGLIGDNEAAAAHVEVSRRLIAAADAQTESADRAPPVIWRRRVVAIVALVLVPFGAAALYLALGSPSLPDQPLASRLAASRESPSVDTLVARVEEHLSRHPDDGRGWEIIAPVYLRVGRFDDAVKARRTALRLNGASAERETALGEALVFAANGLVTAEAKAAFERAVALDANVIQARYFLGLAAEQEGDRAQAAATWRALIESAPPDAPWIDLLRGALARVEAIAAPGRQAGGPGVGPSGEKIAAAPELSPDQRNAMIEGMVERLSERLHRDGADVEGWLRLVRSYMVLGQPDKARAAVADARRALAGDATKLRRLDELLKGLGVEG
ncbi:MAG TPA: c-type cytochrome biogenesis protein CcmI [Xanthobacteraceae bacterium]|jgi:cytochrome c-type biogenesis protein CcmH|nr:c-type cytochrome biogenesis protein CcmI [Xanthobacteraceae bacterium]